MNFNFLIAMVIVLVFGSISIVSSSPTANDAVIYEASSQNKREEQLNILVAKEYPTAATNWNDTSTNLTSIPMPMSVPAAITASVISAAPSILVMNLGHPAYMTASLIILYLFTNL